MTLLESGEMYLETLLVLSSERTRVRSLDLAEYMGFSKPSISRAVKLLREDGYISVDRDGSLTLTEKGQSVAEKIYERHNVLRQFFISMGVSEKTADEDACKIEHIISAESFEAIKKQI